MVFKGVWVIKEKEYKKRRDILASKLPSKSVAILFSNSYMTRSNDTEYPYRQNSNFYYMSGFKEDNSVLVLIKKKEKYKAVLFVNKKDKLEELWNGKRLGQKAARKQFLVDEVYRFDKLEDKLKELLAGTKNLYYDFKLERSNLDLLERYSKNIPERKNLANLVEHMRLVKSNAEVKLIKKAIKIDNLR